MTILDKLQARPTGVRIHAQFDQPTIMSDLSKKVSIEPLGHSSMEIIDYRVSIGTSYALNTGVDSHEERELQKRAKRLIASELYKDVIPELHKILNSISSGQQSQAVSEVLDLIDYLTGGKD
jgi:hypothetical protein